MINNRQMRQRAWQALSGKWNVFYPIMFFSVAFSDALGLKIIYQNFFSKPMNYPVNMFGYQLNYVLAIPRGVGIAMLGAAFIFMLLGLGMNVGEYVLAGNVLSGEKLNLKTLFPKKILGKAILMNLVQYLIIMLGTMLFIIPGIISACNYGMANYLMATNPELGPIEALQLSRERMHGKRMEYLSFQLSFLPWAFGIYLLMNIVASVIVKLTWPGDVIYTMVSWTTTAFLAGYMRVATFAFFKERNNAPIEEEIPVNDASDDALKRAEVAAAAEARHENEIKAEKLYRQFCCSHNALGRAGRLEYYRELGLSEYREEALRRQYGRELMYAFDSDPEALDSLLMLSEEYAMDDLIDRAIARVYRFDREGNVEAETVLVMAEKILKVLHSGAFGNDPGFAARKQTDILNLADAVKMKCDSDCMEGSWREVYHRICDMCGIEEV